MLNKTDSNLQHLKENFIWLVGKISAWLFWTLVTAHDALDNSHHASGHFKTFTGLTQGFRTKIRILKIRQYDSRFIMIVNLFIYLWCYTENKLIFDENLMLNMTDYLRILHIMLSWGHEGLYRRVYLPGISLWMPQTVLVILDMGGEISRAGFSNNLIICLWI